MDRPQLKPNTVYDTTRYEVETRFRGTPKWHLNQLCEDLAEAKSYKNDITSRSPNWEARIVVVTESRRLVP